jgi:hypothetical protein
MPIGNGKRAPRAVGGALAVLLHVAFAVMAVAPPVALCHRADGGTAIELAGPWAVCSCAECEHCLARMSEPGAPASPETSVAPCHCNHEPIRVEAARSSFRRDDGARDLHPFLASASLPSGPAASLRSMPSTVPAFAGPPLPRPSGAVLLRC